MYTEGQTGREGKGKGKARKAVRLNGETFIYLTRVNDDTMRGGSFTFPTERETYVMCCVVFTIVNVLPDSMAGKGFEGGWIGWLVGVYIQHYGHVQMSYNTLE